MIEKKTLQFLKQLKLNNNRNWFIENKKSYDAAKQNLIEFATELLNALKQFDVTLQHLKPEDGLFRINRDVRFSANKNPYKTNMAIYYSAGGKKAENKGGYYLHIEPGAAFIAGGVWQPPAPLLARIRQEIDYNFNEYQKIYGGKKLADNFEVMSEDKLSRPPRGYTADNPAIDHILHKSFLFRKKIGDEVLMQKDAVKQIASNFKMLHPYIAWLNTAMEE